jgi:hypothetical protein
MLELDALPYSALPAARIFFIRELVDRRTRKRARERGETRRQEKPARESRHKRQRQRHASEGRERRHNESKLEERLEDIKQIKGEGVNRCAECGRV